MAPLPQDGAHDLAHLIRVWRNAEIIAREEDACEMRVLLAAVLLHDCVPIEKNAPQRAQASRLSATRGCEIAAALGWDAAHIAALSHAIEAHSFTSGLRPASPEARILHDADKLDAIGAIGIARCFYVAGRIGSALYDPAGAAAGQRTPNDRLYALDHFLIKLFLVADAFLTEAGRRMARERAELMRLFFARFCAEAGV
ncbi:MAG TPA: HD domain-containing protein [Acetobacteraceae bacterium]|nr:HD domain-containing protein [Acetobacteraceae bacterium]